MGRRFSNIILGITLVTFGYTPTAEGQAVQRSAWGQFCNETVKCDKGAWLTCQSSACDCLLDSMIYDEVKGKCVSKTGERCKFQLSDLTQEKIGLALYENTDCVKNAHCANGFTCSCTPGFYETMDGICLEQKEANQKCLSSAECKTVKLLYCDAGYCVCNSEMNHVYAKANNNASIFKCVGKAGHSLKGEASCIEGTVLKDKMCLCNPAETLYAEEGGHCYPRKQLNESCSKNEECQFENNYLTCVEGQCGCDPARQQFRSFTEKLFLPTGNELRVRSQSYSRPNASDSTAFYDSSYRVVYGVHLRQDGYNYEYSFIKEMKHETIHKEQCVGLARKECNSDRKCVKNATCNAQNVCTCNENFSPTSIGTCGIGHGQTCSEATPCSDSFRCTNGLCNCPQIKHQKYSYALQKCVGLVSSYCSDNTDCLDESQCTVNVKSGRKQCACAEGFVKNKAGKCERAWNTACSYKDSIRCDSVGELECRNGVCACPDEMTVFNSTQRKCLGLVGAQCHKLLGMRCVYGAVCDQSVLAVTGECGCADGFTMEEDYTCKNSGNGTESSLPNERAEKILSFYATPTLTEDIMTHFKEVKTTTPTIVENSNTIVGNSKTIAPDYYYSEENTNDD